MTSLIRENKIIIGLIIGYFLIFSSLSVWRHYTFQTQTWDLATFEQSFWNTLQGKIMFNNFEGKNHLAIHFSPILFLLLPIYALWQTPENLLILQTAALAIAALPLYLLAKKILNKNWAIFISALYLIYPSVHWINLFDFHEVPLAIPLIFSSFYFVTKKKYYLASLFLILTAMVSENMIVAVIFMGLYFLLFDHKHFGLTVSLFSLIYFLAVVQLIMPALGGGLIRLDRYAQFGTTAPEIISNVIFNPSLTWQTVATNQKFFYLTKIFLPLLFLPLINIKTLILLVPGLLQNLLTNFEFQFTNFYQYDSILIPFLFIGLIFAVKKILDWQINKLIVMILIAASAMVSFLWQSPLSPFNFPTAKFFNSRTKTFQEILKLIPANASVSAHTNLVPHLTHREFIYMNGDEKFLVDYLIIDSQDLFGFPDQQSFDQYLNIYLRSDSYQAYLIDEQYYIFKKIF